MFFVLSSFFMIYKNSKLRHCAHSTNNKYSYDNKAQIFFQAAAGTKMALKSSTKPTTMDATRQQQQQ